MCNIIKIYICFIIQNVQYKQYNRNLHMSRSWYQLLAQKNPNYKKYQRINKSWFVVDFSFEFKVLPLHKDLFEFLIKNAFLGLAILV